MNCLQTRNWLRAKEIVKITFFMAIAFNLLIVLLPTNKSLLIMQIIYLANLKVYLCIEEYPYHQVLVIR